ncbi:hypothetical protein [Dubosiella newyorkensis]|uniref:hypothetical protein n=1 Tax=Dubosiella newyorkensis TaxID=1862672 RepID=UPI003513E34D
MKRKNKERSNDKEATPLFLCIMKVNRKDIIIIKNINDTGKGVINMTWQQILVIVLGLLLLVGGIPAVWRFAKGAARIILSVIIFLAVIALIWWAIVGLAAAV